MSRRPILGGALGFIALGVCCGLTGFYELFSSFRDYDDEGWLMLSSRFFLDGHVPYTDVPSLYGPAWLAIVQLLHGGLQVPVSHSAARFVTLLEWLLLSGVAAWLTARLTASRAWSATAFVLAFLFVHSIVNEPGHPQALVAMLTLLVPLIGMRCGKRRPAWLLVGATVGVIFHIKYNAGAFCIAAIAVSFASRLPDGAWRSCARYALAAGSFLAPFLLMYPMLADADCRAFALLAGAASAAVAASAFAYAQPGPAPGPEIGGFVAGFVAVSVAALAFAQFHGINAFAYLASALDYAGSQVAFYHFFRPYSVVQLGLACLSLGLAVFVAASGNAAMRERLATLGKTCFALAALYALAIDDPGNSQAMLGYASPWCWSVAVAGADRGPRVLLAATAAWTPLIAYPVPGSQLYFGSLPVLVAAIVCSADVLHRAAGLGWHRASPARVGSVLALVLALGLLAWRFDEARRRYAQYVPLDLAGTGFLRLEPQRTANFRRLVEAVAPADLVFTSFRFNSLALWRGERQPSPLLFSVWPLALSSPVDQARAQQALRQARNPFVVTRTTTAASASNTAMPDWIERDFEPYRTVGPYSILKRRSVPEADTSE